MRVAALIASRNRPDLVDDMVAAIEATATIPTDCFVVECGTEPGRLSSRSTLWYPDPEFRGKCWGHNLALQQAGLAGDYDYYWVLMNDLVFDEGVDPVRALVETMEREERMAILSPTNAEGGYPGASRRPEGGWRKVTTADYLGLMMKARAVDEVGFLRPEFRYCWGAIHDLSYRMYRAGWFLAYSDDLAYRHLGGSTYGVAGTQTISREEYQRNAKRFAYDWFRERYGEDWEQLFAEATAGHEIEVDTFAEHKAYWATGFTDEELALRAPRRADPRPHAARMRPREEPGLVRLHLGCGSDRREGWINVDTNPAAASDITASVDALPMLSDASVDVIEADHLFEHLALHEARAALREWRRVLKPGGELFLELPDRDECLRILGRYSDDRGYDLGLLGLHGWPPFVEQEGAAQVHKWSWSRGELARELGAAGFADVEFGAILQTWRQAARVGRDLRVRAARPVAGAEQDDAWPLGTSASWRVFAWPRWDDPQELEQLLGTFGAPLVGRDDACLCLRRSPESDPELERALAALSAAHERVLGADAALEVLLVDDPLGRDDWRRLGRAVSCLAELPSSRRAPRAELLAELGAPPAAPIGARA